MARVSTPSRPATPPRTGGRIILTDFCLLGGLIASAVFFGWGFNSLRDHPLPLVYASRAERLQQSVAHLTGDPSNASPAPVASTSGQAASPELIDLDRFHALTEDASNVVLDARPALFYQVGHVPGARSLSRESFEANYAALRPLLESRRQNTLAVYCAGGACEDSRLVATALLKLGYPHVVIYEGGWEEWQTASLPEERR